MDTNLPSLVRPVLDAFPERVHLLIYEHLRLRILYTRLFGVHSYRFQVEVVKSYHSYI